MAKLIEVEGIDGSGKTTALKYLIAQLREKGLKVLETREVGSPHIPLCVKLRELILDPANKMDGMAMELVFGAMRIESQKFYDTVKDQYDFIVSDRGLFSHLAYTDHNVDTDFTTSFWENIMLHKTYKPDWVVFLSIDPEVALKRRGIRNGYVDAIEAKGPEFQKLVYGSFVKYLSAYNINTETLDANQTLEGVQEQVRTFVGLITKERLELT